VFEKRKWGFFGVFEEEKKGKERAVVKGKKKIERVNKREKREKSTTHSHIKRGIWFSSLSSFPFFFFIFNFHVKENKK
jgi:hypothetical protein